MENYAKTWVNEYGDMLFGFAYVRVNNRNCAEDLVQDTFLSAVKNYESFEHRSSEKSWLFSILKHKIIDYYRSKSRNNTDYFENNETIDSLFNESGKWCDHVREWQRSPEESMQQTEFRKILQKCIGNLPETQQNVFTLRDLDGLSGEEICNILSLSSSNLWVITHRARHALRNCLTINWFGDEK